MTEFLDISMRRYNAIQAERSSGLKWLLPPYTPADYQSRIDDDKDTAAMRLGRIIHSTVAGAYYQEFDTAPMGVGRRSKQWRGLSLGAGFRELITHEEEQVGLYAADAVTRHPLVAEFLSIDDVAHERSAVIVDQETGIKWKSRPDIHSKSESVVIDLKSTDDIASATHQIRRMNYDMQLAMQALAFGAERGAWIYVESRPPYKVRIIEASQSMLEVGRRKFCYCMYRLKKCRDEGVYPGYPHVVEMIAPKDGELARWVQMADEVMP